MASYAARGDIGSHRGKGFGDLSAPMFFLTKGRLGIRYPSTILSSRAGVSASLPGLPPGLVHMVLILMVTPFPSVTKDYLEPLTLVMGRKNVIAKQ